MPEKADKNKESRGSSGFLRMVLTIVLIAAAFAGAFYLGKRRRAHRFDAFAQCLASRQAKMYGLYWCPHCAEQEEMFGASFRYISYVECGVPGSREEQPSCVQAGVKHFPTWEFAGGERHEGSLPLQMLSQKTGCSLP